LVYSSVKWPGEPTVKPSATRRCGALQEGTIAVPGLRCDHCIAADVELGVGFGMLRYRPKLKL
jgi:hypothetical protein